MKKGILLFVLVLVSAASQAKPISQEWVRRFPGAGSEDGLTAADAMAVDGRGNVFVTGHAATSTGYPDYDIVTIKYSGSGVPLWTNYYDGPAHGSDQPAAIALDRKGNVFVTGASEGDSGSFDYVTIAYSNNGAPLWTNRYNGPANFDDAAQAIAVDRKGAVYVTGYSADASFEYVTIKYSNAGAPLWTNFFPAAQNYLTQQKTVLALGKKGAVFVSSVSLDDTSGPDYATFAYSSDGVPLWTNYYNGPGNDADKPWAIAVDNRDNVFVTGSSYGTNFNLDFATVAYSATGKSLWTNRFDGGGGGADSANAIAVNDRGDVVVAGNSALVSDGGPSCGIVVYSHAGLPLWTNYCTAINSDGQIAAIAINSHNDVSVTGNSVDTTGFTTVQYSRTGTAISTNRYNSPANDGVAAMAIALGRHGDVFVTGWSNDTNGGTDFLTIKYSKGGAKK